MFFLPLKHIGKAKVVYGICFIWHLAHHVGIMYVGISDNLLN